MTTQSHAYDFLQPPTKSGDLGMLGNYRILGELGKGGMGYVFRAEDTVLERSVALKVMNKRIASTPNSRDRFIQEARAMAAVHHDNVVVIFEVGTHEGTPFMAMEMLRGETLEAANARKEARDFRRVIDYASQISRGLAAAHAKGIVHRDIKPANIWIEEGSNRIKILDFGLALAQSPLDEFAGVGSVCGTPGYLTPEQARSDPLDDRSDLYSLGVVLYEMCTGRLPIQRPAIAEQLVGLLSHDPPSITELNSDIPQPLVGLIHQLLAKEPIDRPGSASDLEKMLKKVAVECEAKTEVALSLNKLQESLKEVVSKQATVPDEVIEEPVEILNEMPEFDTYDPLATPPQSSVANPIATAAGSGSIQRIQRVGTPSQAKTKPAPAPTTVSPVVWLAAGVGITLVMVAIGVWMILPPKQESFVIQVPQQPSPTPGQASPTPAKQPYQQPGKGDQPGFKNNQKQKELNRQKAAQRAKDALANEKKNEKKNEVPNNPKKTGDSQPSANRLDNLEMTPEMTRQPMADMALNETPPSDVTEYKTPEPEPLAPVTMADSSMPEPRAENVPTRTVRVPVGFGLGADSTVRKSSGNKSFGTTLNLTVQRRGDEDMQHVYLRFDFQSVSVDRSDIRDAILRMSLFGSTTADDMQLSLYGADIPNAENWQEDGPRGIRWNNSASVAGLDGLTKLAEVKGVNPNEDWVSFQSPELVDFMRQTTGRTLTFVVAGGRGDGLAVRFASREKSDETAPTLYLEVPEG